MIRRRLSSPTPRSDCRVVGGGTRTITGRYPLNASFLQGLGAAGVRAGNVGAEALRPLPASVAGAKRNIATPFVNRSRDRV